VDKARLKSKLQHELREYLTVLVFVAPLLFAFSAYRVLLLGQAREKSFEFGSALINGLVLSKIILIGQYLHLGKRQEHRPLIYSTVWKAFLFTVLVAAFHLLEHLIRGVVHGEGASAALAGPGGRALADLLGRSLVLFFAFLPFFALRETGRVLGEGTLEQLFFRRTPPTGPSTGPEQPKLRPRAA
jgi:Na+-driven multidrug efflux pump